MTNEEYINFANCLKNNYTIDFDVLPEFCDMAISAVKWIPISERLPEVSQNVLATTMWGEVTIAQRLNFGPDYWFIHDGNTNAHTEDIVAWQPLPEPYKGESEYIKKSCNTCKNNGVEFSGECYECLKGIFDHYEPEEEKAESED